MPIFDTLVVVTPAALLMNISSDPSNVCVISRSVAQWPRGGAMAASGHTFGRLVDVVAAAFGFAHVALSECTE